MRSFHNRVALTFSVTAAAAAGTRAVSAQALGVGMVAMRGLHDAVPGTAVAFDVFLERFRLLLFFLALRIVSKGLVDLLGLFASDQLTNVFLGLHPLALLVLSFNIIICHFIIFVESSFKGDIRLTEAVSLL